MRWLLLNSTLALIWAAATTNFTAGSLLAGFLLGFLILVITRPAVGTHQYAAKVWRALRLLLFFIWEMVLANLRVAYDVLTPGYHMRPGVIGVPLDAASDLEITLLANMVTLTPGSVSLDVSSDRRTLYVHVMYLEDVEKARREIKDGFERRILELTR